MLEEFSENPILTPREGKDWEAGGVFNPAAIYLNGKVHIVYRAFSNDNTSTMGYASSKDGLHIDERLEEPIYTPRKDFEKKAKIGVWSGCEDPRLTKIGDRIYMCYTAFDGVHSARVALTSIKVDEFLNQNWNWEEPTLISPPGIDDKDACILPEKIKGQYVIFHRFHPCIWIDFIDSWQLGENNWIKGSSWFKPRTNQWDSNKVGAGPPPIKTDKGWLLIYHGASEKDHKYRAGVMLLDLNNPTRIISRPEFFILGPKEDWEKGIVFPCGAVVIKDKLYVYYGIEDKTAGVATVNLQQFLNSLLKGVEHFKIDRSIHNPILRSNKDNWEEAGAIFNPNAVTDGEDNIHLLYRAISSPIPKNGQKLQISSIGYAESKDGVHFENRRILFMPEDEWEYYGCEDPRVTKFEGKYFIFYTALSTHPPSPEGVRPALATTEDFDKIKKYGIITPFNAKAMTLFPERIQSKMAVIFTLNPDFPPLKPSIALFNNIEELLSNNYWQEWRKNEDENVLSLFENNDKINAEIGATPLKTERGWLLIYSYITGIDKPEQNRFGIGAALLDLENPTKIIANTKNPILEPKTNYEMYGNTPEVIFPSGVIRRGDNLYLYYGAADETCCLATCDYNGLINYLLTSCSN